MFKKIMCLSIIALIVFSIVCNVSAFDIKFDNRGGYVYHNMVNLFDANGKDIYHDSSDKPFGMDSCFEISKDKIAEAAVLQISSMFEGFIIFPVGTHRIWLSGSWKKNMPNRMTFKSFVNGVAITVEGNGASVTSTDNWLNNEKIVEYTV